MAKNLTYEVICNGDLEEIKVPDGTQVKKIGELLFFIDPEKEDIIRRFRGSTPKNINYRLITENNNAPT